LFFQGADGAGALQSPSFMVGLFARLSQEVFCRDVGHGSAVTVRFSLYMYIVVPELPHGAYKYWGNLLGQKKWGQFRLSPNYLSPNYR
jgi:hypothetical protein